MTPATPATAIPKIGFVVKNLRILKVVEVRNPIVLKISPLKGVNINPIAAARAATNLLKILVSQQSFLCSLDL